MTVSRLAAVDAQSLWTSGAIPNDHYALYAFGEPQSGLEPALQEIRDRARACSALRIRIADTGFWTYPVWDPCEVGEGQFVVHELADRIWAACLAAVRSLTDDQLDQRVMSWRLHVYPAIDGVPGTGRGTVAVLQASHAFADGKRSAALAGYLFGREGEVPAVTVPSRSVLAFPRRSIAAALTHRRLVRDTAAGLVPAQADSRPAMRTNTRPAGARDIRTVIRDRAELPGPTVTVGVLTAVSAALAGHLRELGDDPSLLGAEVPMAKVGPRLANNHYGNVGIGLYPDVEAGQRARRIAADLYQRRRRRSHPAMRAEAEALAAVPAPVLRWGVSMFDPDVRSPTVNGNTVVSSVDRGAKDLRFGDAPVLLAASFPALSPMMGLTHGVNGIGETITISVHAAESSIGDVDAYVDRLESELRGS
ncbi:WS/DGAT domain-containing protein [Mycobacterium sp. 236(2023)]|uniref:WS/DGAT domain-containing protein n=1 Tax=Mycobacterium sp. 236(2023) TaxID=3038163 RepID=UPI0024155205|nr:WS/DGAT domain-containing protein [Mycobacterium sp. 236(2023)]MDG4666095.1 WS/DGAT domain-containing protein [Mycobacterium sp. 236(2023)]